MTLLWISGTMVGGKECRVRHVAETDLHSAPGGVSLPYWAELLDADGRVLGVTTLLRTAQWGCGGDGGVATEPRGSVHFATWLPIHPGAERLRIRTEGGEVLWERKRAGKTPEVHIAGTQVSEGAGEVTVSWKTSATDSSDTWLQWQPADASDGWRALRVGLSGTTAAIPLECLPTGDVRFRVVVHDGFATGRAVSDLVGIPPRAPVVGIVHPVPGVAHGSPAYLLLWGYGRSADGEDLSDDALVWRVNGREVGRGRTVPFALEPGRQSLHIELEGSDGKRSSRADVKIEV